MRELKKLIKKIAESTIDIPKKNLSKDVWDYSNGEYSMKPEVRSKILQALRAYPELNLLKLASNISIVGSIATNLYTDTTDIDIHVTPDVSKLKTLDVDAEKLVKDIMDYYNANRDINNWYVKKHPFEVYLQLDPKQDAKSDAVYDLIHSIWIKKPEFKSYNPYVEYKDEYLSIDDLVKDTDKSILAIRRGLIDFKNIYNSLSELPKERKESMKKTLKEVLDKIESEILKLSKDKQNWKDMRRSITHHSDNSLSKEWQSNNAKFKFIQRYLYLNLISSLDRLLEDGELEETEIQSVQDELNKFFTGV